MKLDVGDIDKIILKTKDGKEHDIVELAKKDYEYFLLYMEMLRTVYITLVRGNNEEKN